MVKGVALYNIELDGCLNGVFTNDNIDGQIFNEIAKISTSIGADGLSGIYHCFYFDSGNSRNDAELTIGIANGTTKKYDFSWVVNNKIVFKGVGYKMNEKQVVVHYWDN